MKWFKHDANAILDSKLKKLKLKYGMEGYGLYWYCLECIARNIEAHNLSFELEEDSELIAADTGIHYERVEEMMRYMVSLRLFEQSNGIITCLKMATRTDEYTQKLIKENNSLLLSRQTPDNVGKKSELIEENRRDKNRTEQKRTEQKDKTSSFSLPEWVPSQEWKDYEEMRMAKDKKSWTPAAMKLNVKRLEKLVGEGYDAKEVLNQSVENGWKGLYPIKETITHSQQTRYPISKQGAAHLAMEEIERRFREQAEKERMDRAGSDGGLEEAGGAGFALLPPGGEPEDYP